MHAADSKNPVRSKSYFTTMQKGYFESLQTVRMSYLKGPFSNTVCIN